MTTEQITKFIPKCYSHQAHHFYRSFILRVIFCSVCNYLWCIFTTVYYTRRQTAKPSDADLFYLLNVYKICRVYSSLLGYFFSFLNLLAGTRKYLLFYSNFQELSVMTFVVRRVFICTQNIYRIFSILKKQSAYQTKVSSSFTNASMPALKLSTLLSVYSDKCSKLQCFPKLHLEFHQYIHIIQTQARLFQIISTAYNSNLK